MSINNTKINPYYLNFISGGIAGLVEVSCLHPIDFIKTKMQESVLKTKNYKINNIANNIYKNNGINGFYRGFVPRLFCIVPMRVLYWGVQNNTNEYLKTYNIKKSNRLILSGTFAGTVQTIIDNPIENIKIKMMTNKRLSIFQIMKESKYPGFLITSLRNAGFAICVNVAINYNDDKNPKNIFLLGATGGFLGSVITQPLDFIKTELQRDNGNQNYKYIINIIKKNPNHLMTGWQMRSLLGLLSMGIGGLVCNIIKNI